MLQLEANTKRPTPRCSAICASATLAFSLIASVTPSNSLPIGSLEIAARWTTTSTPSSSSGGKFPISPKCMRSSSDSGNLAAPVRLWAKNARIKADQFGVWKFLPEVTRKDGADIAHRTGNQNTHGIFLLHHFFQGALLLDQRSSRYRLSRNVSIGCQKPSWRNTLSWPSSREIRHRLFFPDGRRRLRCNRRPWAKARRSRH